MSCCVRESKCVSVDDGKTKGQIDITFFFSATIFAYVAAAEFIFFFGKLHYVHCDIGMAVGLGFNTETTLYVCIFYEIIVGLFFGNCQIDEYVLDYLSGTIIY